MGVVLYIDPVVKCLEMTFSQKTVQALSRESDDPLPKVGSFF